MNLHQHNLIQPKNNDDLLQDYPQLAMLSFVDLASTILNNIAIDNSKIIVDENDKNKLKADVNSEHSECERHRLQQEKYQQHQLTRNSPSLSIPAENTALIVTDVQPEYWSNCPLIQKDFPDFPQILERTIELCRERQVKIIWIRADYRYCCSPWLPNFERMRGGRNLGEVPCDLNSPDLEWESFAHPIEEEIIIPKHCFSGTTNTSLVEILRTSRIDTVLVCGLVTSVCVHHTAYGLFDAGLRTFLVQDACADRGLERHKATLNLYGDYMYDVINTEDLESEESLIPAGPPLLGTTNESTIDNPSDPNCNKIYTTVYGTSIDSEDKRSSSSPLIIPTYVEEREEVEN
jgi:nicotinamidase-related amidase